MSCSKVYISEAEFQSAVIKRLKDLKFYVRNIPDIGNVRKPFDVSVNYSWIWGALELKIIKTAKAPTPESVYKMLYPHQVANLFLFKNWESQGVSFVMAYYANSNLTYVYDVVGEETSVRLEELGSFFLNSEEFKEFFCLKFRDRILQLSRNFSS